MSTENESDFCVEYTVSAKVFAGSLDDITNAANALQTAAQNLIAYAEVAHKFPIEIKGDWGATVTWATAPRGGQRSPAEPEWFDARARSLND